MFTPGNDSSKSDQRKSTRVFVVGALLLSGFLLSSGAWAQCAISSTAVNPVGGSSVSILKYFTGAPVCNLVSSNNAGFCFPSATSSASTLLASANTMAASPSCNWVCNCGTASPAVPFTIDGGDGLPVELLEFSIDDGTDEAEESLRGGLKSPAAAHDESESDPS